MPELPEVETVKNTLIPLIKGSVITSVKVRWDNIIASDLFEFKDKVVNQKINNLNRIGKYIIFELDDYALIIHLRMEGKFFIKSKLDELNKHEHVIFGLDTGEELRYHDTRKFGKMHLVDINGYEKSFPLSQLGFEPFDELCDASYLYKKIKNKSIPIKQALLDQSILVGLGNIYVNEVLFRTRLHPEKRCNTITKKKCAEIIDASIETLNKAISLGGTTIRSYYTTDGVHGRFQNELLVHGRENELCFNCMSEIEKIKVGGRGTYYCPNCQKK